LMKSSALELIPIGPRAGIHVICVLEDGWSLLLRMIQSRSVTAVACSCRFPVDVH
jgi:hypothetical protein